ncbi:MAG: recombination protein O N-terminal domain-containing protein [Candidatus Pacebacteria bacterium]|nr:recombination protein O N-terminal domain-containing protein [Candidatus Paceibacterota bacterium]
MRHKYETRGIVLARTPVGEASSFITLVSSELGLVRVLAQSVRKPGAKLAAALATFAESSVVLVHGRDGWRLAGAVFEESWFARLRDADARKRAGRVSGLLLRLVAGEERDTALFPVMKGFLEALSNLPSENHEDVEILAVLRILATLGLDTSESDGISAFTPDMLAAIAKDRTSYISRINRGIEASGL